LGKVRRRVEGGKLRFRNILGIDAIEKEIGFKGWAFSYFKKGVDWKILPKGCLCIKVGKTQMGNGFWGPEVFPNSSWGSMGWELPQIFVCRGKRRGQFRGHVVGTLPDGSMAR